MQPVWFKLTVIALPFAANLVDVSSWYLVKIFHPFVYVEIAAGALMAACFGIMLLVTMYPMWFSSAPAMVAERVESLG